MHVVCAHPCDGHLNRKGKAFYYFCQVSDPLKDKETTLHSLGIKRYARTTAHNYKARSDKTEQLILAIVNEVTS